MIIKHLYYTAQRGGGIPEKNEAIWLSLRNHLVDRHEFPENALYSRCEHEEETGRVWMKAGKSQKVKGFLKIHLRIMVVL